MANHLRQRGTADTIRNGVGSARKVFFYPHTYLRDRHLDTIRSWPQDSVVNPELGTARTGGQVPRERSLSENFAAARRLLNVPLINIKARPASLPPDVVVYVWGAVMLTGPYIVELDNPFALTRYNLDAIRLYRAPLRRLLLQDRCVGIRCISRACRETLGALLGDAVYAKSEVRYPEVPAPALDIPKLSAACRFLFVSTQFEVKAGPTVLRAFREIYRDHPDCTLDVVTHLPDSYRHLVDGCAGIRLHEAAYTRGEVWDRFMTRSDVLVHPTIVESFGMVVLEALAHGLAVIATDVYALGEMVNDGQNGVLLRPPMSIWDGYLPSREYYELGSIKQRIRAMDDTKMQAELTTAMRRFVADPEFRRRARIASLALFRERFAREEP